MEDAVEGAEGRGAGWEVRRGAIELQMLERGACGDMFEIAGLAGEKIIKAHDGVTVAEEAIAKMRTDKASGAGDENTQSGWRPLDNQFSLRGVRVNLR